MSLQRTPDLFERIAELRRDGQSFALATVVGRRAPVSAHLGDRAIVFADGRMDGFVGGACAREIVRQQALESLRTRQGRLVSIRPDAAGVNENTSEHVIVPMTCASEGAVDVYVEPFVEPRRLVIVGATPVAAALARLARAMDYGVTRSVDARELRDLEPESATFGVTLVALDALEQTVRGNDSAAPAWAAVVASQGHYDEEALAAILKCGIPYVALVASRKRGADVRTWLEQNHVQGADTIRNPAGLDLGARTPMEVALSILAEIVQTQTHAASCEPQPKPHGDPLAKAVRTTTLPMASASAAVDPVCGMQVDTATARHTAEVNGVTYYFCCANCRTRFMQQPQDYLRANA